MEKRTFLKSLFSATILPVVAKSENIETISQFFEKYPNVKLRGDLSPKEPETLYFAGNGNWYSSPSIQERIYRMQKSKLNKIEFIDCLPPCLHHYSFFHECKVSLENDILEIYTGTETLMFLVI